MTRRSVWGKQAFMASFATLPTPVPTDVPFEDRSVEILGLKLRYRLWGDRDKPLLVLQHGGKDHSRSWDWTVAALVDRYAVATPDLRGHGDSDWVPGTGYNSIEYLSDFAEVMADLEGLGFTAPFTLVGHSLGGNITLRYAAAFPDRVRRLVNIEGLGPDPEKYAEMMQAPPGERLAKAVERRRKLDARGIRTFGSQEAAVSRLENLHTYLPAADAAHLALHALRRRGEGWSWKHDPALFTLIEPTPPEVNARLYQAISCPVLLLYGGKSWTTSPAVDGRLGEFQKARLEVYEEAGHWLHHQERSRFLADLTAFLEEAAP